MTAKIISLFTRLPQDPQAAESANKMSREEPYGLCLDTADNAPSANTRQEASFPPICLIEPLSAPCQGALHELLKGEFDHCFERRDYRVKARRLAALQLTVLLAECQKVSILTLLDPGTGKKLCDRFQAGDFPSLESLLRHLARLAATSRDTT